MTGPPFSLHRIRTLLERGDRNGRLCRSRPDADDFMEDLRRRAFEEKLPFKGVFELTPRLQFQLRDVLCPPQAGGDPGCGPRTHGGGVD